MPSRLAGKTVLITGASSGIGRATALEFSRTAADNKISLILAARRIDTLKEVKAEIETETAGRTKVLAVQLDVSDPVGVRGFLPSLPEEWRKVDVLVNNAGGVRGVEKVGEIAEEDVQVMIDVNVIGLINVSPSFIFWEPGEVLMIRAAHAIRRAFLEIRRRHAAWGCDQHRLYRGPRTLRRREHLLRHQGCRPQLLGCAAKGEYCQPYQGD